MNLIETDMICSTVNGEEKVPVCLNVESIESFYPYRQETIMVRTKSGDDIEIADSYLHFRNNMKAYVKDVDVMVVARR